MRTQWPGDGAVDRRVQVGSSDDAMVSGDPGDDEESRAKKSVIDEEWRDYGGRRPFVGLSSNKVEKNIIGTAI